jgi:hypothetical protein
LLAVAIRHERKFLQERSLVGALADSRSRDRLCSFATSRRYVSCSVSRDLRLGHPDKTSGPSRASERWCSVSCDLRLGHPDNSGHQIFRNALHRHCSCIGWNLRRCCNLSFLGYPTLSLSLSLSLSLFLSVYGLVEKLRASGGALEGIRRAVR